MRKKGREEKGEGGGVKLLRGSTALRALETRVTRYVSKVRVFSNSQQTPLFEKYGPAYMKNREFGNIYYILP